MGHEQTLHHADNITLIGDVDDTMRLLRITENAPVMLAEVDKTLHYTFVNSSYASLFGYNVSEVIGKPVKDILGDIGYADGKAYMHQVLSGKPTQYTLDLSEILGEPKILSVSYSPNFDEAGAVSGFLAAIMDKTTEVAALKRVDELNAQLRAAHDLSLNGFIVLKAIRSDTGNITDFSYVYANSKAEEIAGKKLVGHQLLELFPGNKETGLYDAYISVVETGDVFVKELHYEHDGLNFWLEISVIKLSDGCALSFKDISERKNSEEHNKLLLNELNHRVKNTLATVQSMASQTALGAKSIEEFQEKFQPRLRSISDAHDILLTSKTGYASLKTMISRQLRPYIAIGSERLKLIGTDVLLNGATAHALGLVLHELATNACKYGALSNDTGHITVQWSRKKSIVNIEWIEKDGPLVLPPKHKGFGSVLIEHSLKYGLNGNVVSTYNPEGVKVEIRLPVE